MPRVEIPLIGPSYTSREKGLSSQVTKNMWPEVNPEAKNQVCLHNAAGLKLFSVLEGKDRGLHDFNNLLYAVNGYSLYSIGADGESTNLGTIAGESRCIMANDSTQLIIVTGGTAYRYTVAGGLETITDENLTDPTWVDYKNQQFILDNNAGNWGEFVTTNVDADFAVDPLDFATAESHPDDIVRGIDYRDFMYFFGSHSVEPWRNTGTGNPPWQRVSSGVQPYGIAGLHAVTKTNEYMYFLDSRRIPRRSNGLNFQSIGNPALGVEFAKYSTIDDVIAFAFSQDNQQFFALTFPSEDRTWCFHEPSGTWFQLSYGIDDARHRASSMIHIYGLNICADHTNGKLYEYALDTYTDDGAHIIKQRDTASIHGGMFGAPGQKLFFNEVEFIIESGYTDVAGTGLGPQPIVPDTGVCGTNADLTQGQLLNVGALSQGWSGFVEESLPNTNGVNIPDSNVISFTTAFTIDKEPIGNAYQISIYDTDNATDIFGVYMDTDGYINIKGYNAALTKILDAQITNNGSTFADGNIHVIAFVANMDNSDNREIYVDNRNVGESSAWVTWNTYIDGMFALSATLDNRSYCFGGVTTGGGYRWFIQSGEVGSIADTTLGYVSFDNNCTLICSAVWDDTGYVRDPQAWEGWYKAQPKVFFGPSLYKNSGSTAPTFYGENGMESVWGNYISGDSQATYQPPAATVLNAGIGGTTEASDRGTLPDAPDADPRVEITSPFWNSAGNWIDLSKLTQTTFLGMFGRTIEGNDFNAGFDVNKAALVNTSDSGNRLQIKDTQHCSAAAMYVTDEDGDVVDSMFYYGQWTGDSVLVPTGANYYIVITSDTGRAKVKKWDTE